MEQGRVRRSASAIRPEQHFTEPPPRFTEASLVKALEAYGIGRPSTYATIIQTLESREYVTLDKRRFKPTDVGRVVNKFLSEHFFKYVDYDFTARMEDDLDAISRGEKEWKPVLQDFWVEFKNQVKEKEIGGPPRRRDDGRGLPEVRQEAGQAPRAQRLLHRLHRLPRVQLHAQRRRRGRRLERAADRPGPQVPEVRVGPGDQARALRQVHRLQQYPNCKHMEPLEKPADTGVECPECKQATMLKRKSRYGKVFYSCARYPDCKYAVWNLPLKPSPARSAAGRS
jgi:DNA topoisomerase I